MTILGDSKRTQILKAFQALLKTAPVPTTWSVTERKPLLRVAAQNCPAFYVFDFQEQVIDESKQTNDLVRAAVYIVAEIFVAATLSDEPSDVLNEYLWAVQKVVQGNKLDGLVQKIQEVGSKLKVESAEQRLYSAEIAFKLTYVRNK